MPEGTAGLRIEQIDLFEAIARQLFDQTKLVTAPGAVDPRWPAIVAQAYREGIARVAESAGGGVLFRLDPTGGMDVIAVAREQMAPLE